MLKDGARKTKSKLFVYSQGRQFSFFPGRGQHFDRLPRGGGAKYLKN